MDGPARPAAISRIHSRYRNQSEKLPQKKLPVPDLHHPHEPLAQAGRDARPRSTRRMTRGHRFFHRRAALADPEVVVVEVVNKVDELGNVVAQETVTPTLSNSLPTAAPLPLPDASVLAVPSVPIVSNVPAPTLPSVPVSEVPAVPISALPAVPVPALPTVAVPALPTVAVPELPTVAVPQLPTIAVPELPTVLPSVPVPELPSVPVPVVPNVPVPALPSVPVPVLPSVPAPPTVPVPVLPSVPAVPPFPTSLQVPSVPDYPFPTLFPVAHAVSPSASASAPGVETTPAPYVPLPVPASAINSATNMTLSSSASLLPSSSLASLNSISASEPADFAVSIQAVPSAPASDLQYLPSSALASFTQTLITSHSARSTSTASKPTTTATPTTTTTIQSSNGGAGGVGFGGVPAETSSATSEPDSNSSPSALETPKVIGSVLGSLAGAALILALILFLLRRHKQRRGGALQLTGDERENNHRSVSQAPTATSAFVPIAFLNRFSGMSGRTAETHSSGGGERGFQRVSGRKLPSAFSEGMTSDQFSGGGTMSVSSFYQDDHGMYGGPGISKEFGKEIGDTSATRESGQMNIRPSPARTPVIRHPDDGNPFADRHHLSPPHSPVGELPPRGTLGRSLPSADGSRSSKFTENV